MTLRMGDSGQLVAILQNHFNRKRSRLTGVEVGVHRGATSAALLRAFPQLFLVMVDPWSTYETSHPYRKSGDGCASFTAKEQLANMIEAMNATDFAFSRRSICATPSVEAAKIQAELGRRFDFAFIDGDHTYEAVKADIAAWWSLVDSGGLLAGHDIDHPRDVRGVWGVRRAVEEHAAATGLTFDVDGSCWWFVKG